MAGRTTRWIRAGWRPSRDPAREPVIPPVFVSAIYTHPAMSLEREYPKVGDLKYSRENNPTLLGLEEALAELESADWALAFTSGMAALTAITVSALARGARRIAVMRLTYGSTRSLVDLLRRVSPGIEVEVAGPPWDKLLEAVARCDLAIVESMANPTLRVPPLRDVYRQARESGCMVAVDNTFATPLSHRPLESGASFSIESLTKYISGHNDVVAGSAAGNGREELERLWDVRRLLGTTLQPIEAYMAWRGMKTLEVRFERQSRSAAEVAEWLESHSKVSRVYYPGLPSHPDYNNARRELEGLYGGVVSFELRGGRRAAFKLLSSLKLIEPSPSFGGVESLISYPALASHSNLSEEERRELGITDGLLRLSVGLEDVADIVDDLARALRSV
ncbi:MAG: PLP-dependent transferase [Aeropyrum sp.]|nr:PLP-dependent transferase [Aeropyrum sp.]